MKNITLFLMGIFLSCSCKKFVKIAPIVDITFVHHQDSLLLGMQDTLLLNYATGESNESVNFTFLFIVNQKIEKQDQILFKISDPSIASIYTEDGKIILKAHKLGTVFVTAYTQSNSSVNATYMLKVYDSSIFIRDVNFRRAIQNAGILIDVNTGVLLLSTAFQYTGLLNVSGQGINDLSGIEYFTSITGLICSNNNLKDSISFSKMHNLTYIDCSNNQLSNLYVKANQQLKQLICFNNFITTFDVSDNINLTNLNCRNNNNLSVHISSHQNLQYIHSTPPSFVGATHWVLQ